jgi:glucose-6-phosphate isomerase
MALKATNPTTTDSWEKLQSHFEAIKSKHLKDLFSADAKRADELTVKWDDFYVDFSKNRITKETLELLFVLGKEVDLKDAISKYFKGDLINATEGRAVLHTALRAPIDAKVFVDGVNVIPEIHDVKVKIKNFTDAVVNGSHKGCTGKAITDIVNIGIGGSDLGPAMVVDALQYYKNQLNTHFVSNVDGDHHKEIIKN